MTGLVRGPTAACQAPGVRLPRSRRRAAPPRRDLRAAPGDGRLACEEACKVQLAAARAGEAAAEGHNLLSLASRTGWLIWGAGAWPRWHTECHCRPGPIHTAADASYSVVIPAAAILTLPRAGVRMQTPNIPVIVSEVAALKVADTIVSGCSG